MVLGWNRDEGCRFPTSLEPFEQEGELVPELLKRWQHGQLVAEHVLPLRLQFADCRRLAQGNEGWDGHVLYLAFVDENLSDRAGMKRGIMAAKEVDDVVQVSRPPALAHRTELLREHFLERIAAHLSCGCE